MSNSSSLGNGNSFGAPTTYFQHQKKWVCPAFLNTTITSNPLFESIHAEGNVGGHVMVTVKASELLSGLSKFKKLFVRYWASAPPSYIQSYSGSGMPFPNPEIAFENTPNKGVFPLPGHTFQIAIDYPNSYYEDGGKVYIPPKLQFTITDSQGKDLTDINEIQLGEGIPFRTLQWPRQRNWLSTKPFGGSLFYLNNEMPPVRSQEQILKESAYPSTNIEPTNFWGLRPPY